MADKTNEKIESEIKKHLREGESLIAYCYASEISLGPSSKFRYIGLTDQRFIINKRTYTDKDNGLDEIPITDITVADVRTGFPTASLEIQARSGKKLRFNLMRAEDLPAGEHIVDELQKRRTGLPSSAPGETLVIMEDQDKEQQKPKKTQPNRQKIDIKQVGKRNMLLGALWFGIGIAVTIGTMSSSSSFYVIAWGAILFGAVQFLIGLSQYRSG